MHGRIEEYTDEEWQGLLHWAAEPLTRAYRTRNVTATYKGKTIAWTRRELRKPRHRRITPRPPDGLLTPCEAAAKLRCSTKTLAGHVASGALRYVQTGHGTRRPRRMFTEADLDAFIEAQTRKAAPCPSTATRARHIGNSTSRSEVIAFTARPSARPGAKPKR